MNGRIALSTKTLEPEPGDMIKNPQKVYDMAEVRRGRGGHVRHAEIRSFNKSAFGLIKFELINIVNIALLLVVFLFFSGR